MSSKQSAGGSAVDAPYAPFERSARVDTKVGWRFRCPSDHSNLWWQSPKTVECNTCARLSLEGGPTYAVEEITDVKTGRSVGDLMAEAGDYDAE